VGFNGRKPQNSELPPKYQNQDINPLQCPLGHLPWNIIENVVLSGYLDIGLGLSGYLARICIIEVAEAFFSLDKGVLNRYMRFRNFGINA
jgi:hypothetical protein